MLLARLTVAALVVLVGLAGLGAPAVAGGTTVDDVVRSLRADPVYVDPDVGADVDADRVRRQIQQGGLPVYVAVLPPAAARALGGERQLNRALGSRLGASAVLLTAVGDSLTGGAGAATGLAPGQADALARQSRGSDVSDRLVSAVSAVQAAAGRPGGGAGTGSGSSTTTAPATGSGGGGLVLGVIALLGVGAAALYVRSSRRRRSAELQGSRADVQSLYDRLGADVATLHPGDDPVARQALADAAERYNATGALLSQADTPGEFEAARRTVVEGLAAARLARERIGLDPGPDIPPPPGSGSGPQLQREEVVQVGDREVLGSPVYQPGRQHYWGGGMVGGTMVPGGWYGVPWGSLIAGGLLGSALSGGFGSHGYADGYEEGVEDAADVFRGGGGGGGGFGGDWGSGGGGDWGGGGGDWGGDGGNSQGSW